MSQVLLDDGTIDPKSVRSGKIDPSGYSMQISPDGKPQFIPTADRLERREVKGKNNNSLHLGASDANWNQDFANAVDQISIYAVAIQGDRIFIGGDWDRIENQFMPDFAVYDNSLGQWSNMGLELNGCCSVQTIEIIGSNVYVGGYFFTNSGIEHLAKWDGSSWSSVGNNQVYDVSTVTEANGVVYVGGWFTNLNGDPNQNYVAAWDGSQWTALSEGLPYRPYVLKANDNGTRIYAGGWGWGLISDGLGGTITHTEHVAYWDIGLGTWNPLDYGVDGWVYDMEPDGNNMWIVGDFFTATNDLGTNILNTQYIARWSEASGWNSLYGSNSNLNSYIFEITKDADVIYVSGYFNDTQDGLSPDLNGVASYQPALTVGWESLNQGITQTINRDPSIASENGKIVVGGSFVSIDNVFTKGLGVYNGADWTASSTGPTYGPADVRGIAVIGDELYIGGFFGLAGGQPVSNIVSYNLTTQVWSDMAGGMDYEVNALEVFNNELYAGGYFNTAGGVSTNGVAKWNGTSWVDIGALNNGVNTLETDGTDLYVGGCFGSMGGVANTPAIAKYNPGLGWSALGTGFTGCVEDISLENGKVYAAGSFYQTGDGLEDMFKVAVYETGSWAQLGTGLNETLNDQGWTVNNIEAVNGEIYIGGYWAQNTPQGSAKLALDNTWTGFMPGDYSEVQALARRGDDLVIGGYFWPNNSDPHSPMITVMRSDGTFTKVDKGANGTIIDVFLSGDQIAMIGYFDRVNSDIASTRVGMWTSPTITTSPLAVSSAQGRDFIDVSYTVTGSFDSDNLFYVQLSDDTGDFSNGQIIGTLQSGTDGTVQALVPLDISGTGYKIRVTASSEAILSGTQDFTIVAGGQPLDYYWIGGTGNWSDLNHWSTTSGGSADHATIPTRVDNIFFDANSFDGDNQQVTLDQQINDIGNIDWTGVTNNPSFYSEYQNFVNFYGDVTFSDDMRLNLSRIFFKTDTDQSIDFPTGDQNWRADIFFEGSGTYNIVDSLFSAEFRVNSGTLNTNNNPIAPYWFHGSGNETIINLGSSDVYVNYWNISGATLSPGDYTIYASWYWNDGFDGRGYNYNRVVLNRRTWLYGSHSFDTLEFAPGSEILLESGETQTVNTLIAVGKRSLPIRLKSTNDGNQATISVPVTGTVSALHLFIQDNNATGGATFTADQSFIESNVTGWNSTPWTPISYFWIGNGGEWDDLSHWSTTSGGSADMTDLPGSIDNIFFDANSFDTDNQQVNLPVDPQGNHIRVEVGDISWTGVTNNPIFWSDWPTTLYVSGSLAFSPNMSSDLKYIQFLTLSNTGQRTISGSNYLSHNIQFFETGDWVLADSISAIDIYITGGSFSTNGHSLDLHYLSSDTWGAPVDLSFSNSDVYILKSMDLRSFDQYPLTTDFTNSTIHIDYEGGVEDQEIYLRGLSYDKFIIGDDPDILGDQSYNGTRFYGNGAIDTLVFLPGTTSLFQESTTITVEDIIANGTDEDPITLSSQKNDETFTFQKSTGVINAYFLNLKDNIATTDNDAVFNAFSTLTSGTVTGWVVETGPDASVSETTLSFNKAVPGSDIAIYTRVTNTGDIILPASNLKFFISDDDRWDTSDTELGTEETIDNLSLGESNVKTQVLNLPSSLATNTDYFVFAVYDTEDLNTEIRNGNNYEPIRISTTDELPPQELLFSVLEGAGGSSAEVANDIAGDVDGNSYITGFFADMTDFGGTQLTALGASDIFLSKLDQDGNYVWTTQIGSSSNNFEQGRSVTLDDNGNPIVVGFFDQEAIFYDDNGIEAIRLTSQGQTDGFVAKFDKATGSVLWANRFGGTGFDEAADAVVFGNNVYVTGFTRGVADLAGISVDGTGSQANFFVANISNVTGQAQNGVIDGLGYRSFGETITINPANGNVFIGGYFERDITIGPRTLNSDNQSEDGFIAKYDANLSFINSVRGGSFQSDRVNDLAFDQSNNVLYAGGDFFQDFCFPDWCTGSNGREDGFVAKLNPDDFSTFWMNSTYVSGAARIRSITVDEEGAVYYAGAISGFLETGTKAISTQGDFDALIGRFFSDSGFDFVDGFGGTGDDVVFGVDVAANKIQMSGSYFGAMDIPGVGRLISTGNRDVMVATASTDRVAPSIESVDFPPYHAVGSGSTASISGVFDNNAVERAEVHYRLISQPSSNVQIINANAPGNTDFWEIDLSFLESDPLGALYFFRVYDFDGNSTDSEYGETWLEYTDGLNMPIPNVGTSLEDFRMISFPLEISNASASAIFGSAYGNSNDAEDKLYLLYRFANGSVSANKNGQVNIGEGYWFLTSQNDPNAISSKAGRVPQKQEGDEFTLSVSDGWHLIGNPYNMNISAQAFYNANPDLEQRLEYWTGSGYSSQTNMEPFRGYFVKANAPTTITFPIVNSSGGRTTNSEEPVLNELSENEWGVALNVKAGNLDNNRFQFGMASDALDSKDQHDLSSLPEVFNYASLKFDHSESEDGYLMKDIVETKFGHVWKATFDSNLEDEVITLSWDNTYWGSNDLTIVLYDKNKERLINMRDHNSYGFRNTGKRGFEIIFGTEDFIRENVMPENLVVNTYPNPFRGETTIEFALPETNSDYKVKMEIYNSMGQWVTTLMDDVLNEGFHKVTWNARNANGAELGQGIYIYKLTAIDREGTLKQSGRLIIR